MTHVDSFVNWTVMAVVGAGLLFGLAVAIRYSLA
jgi:hypothetical protein